MDRSQRGRVAVPPTSSIEPTGGERLGSWIRRRRAALGAVCVLATAAAGGAWCWSLVGDRVLKTPRSVLDPENITVEGVSDWVKGDLRTEALANAQLGTPMLIDDPDLARSIARAFSMHPWVRQVEEVRLSHPASAVVRVACREPIAMVRVEGGLLPIDGESVVLPSDAFTSEQAASYPKVTGIQTSPRGPPGTPWGDPLVEQAAVLAAVVRPEWLALGLTECHFDTEASRPGWRLLRESGGPIRFGPAPGFETPGEPSAAVKVARLRQLVTDPTDAPVDLTTLPSQDGT